MRRQLFNRRTLPLLLLAGALVIATLLYLLRPQPVAVADAEKRWHVAATVITPGTKSPTLPLYGFIESPKTAQISSAVLADVAAVHVLAGQSVAAEQLLIELDQADLAFVVVERQAALDETLALLAQEKQLQIRDEAAQQQEKTLLELAERGVKRAKQLAEQRLGPAAKVDEAERTLAQQQLALNTRNLSINNHPARLQRLNATVSRNQALLAQAQLDIERTQIGAVFAGRIAQVKVAIGDRVQRGSPLLTLYDTSQLELRAQIPNQHVGVLRAALQRGIRLSARAQVDGRPIEFVLDRLAGETARESGGINAFFRLNEAHDGLPLGLFLDIQLTLPAVDNVVAIPFAALYGNNRIYRVIGGRMRPITVTRVGSLNDSSGQDSALIRAPELKLGDQVVLTQLPNAVDGLLVQTTIQP